MNTIRSIIFGRKKPVFYMNLLLIISMVLQPIAPTFAKSPDEADPSDPSERLVETWQDDRTFTYVDNDLSPQNPPLILKTNVNNLIELIPEEFVSLSAVEEGDQEEVSIPTQNGSNLILKTQAADIGVTGTAVSFFDSHVLLLVDNGTFSGNVSVRLQPIPVPLSNSPEVNQPLFDSDGFLVGMSGSEQEWLRFKLEVLDAITGEEVITFNKPIHIAVDTRNIASVEEGNHWEIGLGIGAKTSGWTSNETIIHNQEGILSTTTLQPDVVIVSMMDEPVSWKPSWIAPTVSEFSGAATFEYPVEVPAGRNKLQPDLTIRYSSRGVDVHTLSPEDQGWLGLGFSMGEISIVRSKYDIAGTGRFSVKYYDNFALNLGGQNYELKRTSNVGNQTQYVAINAPQLFVQQVYDSGHTGGNIDRLYWIVKTPDGTTYRLGYTPNATEGQSTSGSGTFQEMGNQHFGYSSSWGARTWYVDTITDIHGNQMQYDYFERSQTDEWNGSYLHSQTRQLLEIRYNYRQLAPDPNTRLSGAFPDDFATKIRMVLSSGENYRIDRIEMYHLAYMPGNKPYRIVDLGLATWDSGWELCGQMTTTEYISSIQIQGYDKDGNFYTLPATNLSYEEWGHGWIDDIDGDGGEESERCYRYKYLKTVDDSYGGSITFNYATDGRLSHGWQCYCVPAYGYSYFVEETISNDGINDPATIEYILSNPCYDQLDGDVGDLENAFNCPTRIDQSNYSHGALVGFTDATIINHDFNSGGEPGSILNKRIMHFHTDPRKMGRPEWSELKNADDFRLQRQDISYLTDDSDASGNDFTYTASDCTTTYTPGGQSDQHCKSYDYDRQSNIQYGNLTRSEEEGYLGGISNQKRLIYREYYPNTTDWIISKVAREAIYIGIAGQPINPDTSNPITESRNYYDDHTNWNTAPEDGMVTKVEQMMENAVTAIPPSPMPVTPTPTLVPGTISGGVLTLGDDLYPWPGAQVMLWDTSTNQYVATTTADQDGYYIFSGVSSGNYNLYACGQINGQWWYGFLTGVTPPNTTAHIIALQRPCALPPTPTPLPTATNTPSPTSTPSPTPSPTPGVPLPPYGLTADEPQEATIRLTWKHNDPANVDHFKIYRNTSLPIPLDSSHLIAEYVPNTAQDYWDYNPIYPDYIFYVVTAVNNFGEVPSNYACFPTPQCSGSPDDNSSGTQAVVQKAIIPVNETLLNTGGFTQPILLAPENAVYAIVQTVEYDDFGNPTLVRDGNNNPTAIGYDTIFNLYPIQTTNALGHMQLYGYNFLNASQNNNFPGSLREAQDANGLWTYYFYDPFGRLGRVFRGWNEQGGDWTKPSEIYHYADTSFPMRITSWRKTQDNAAAWSNGGVFERTFYDGFGNPIQVQTGHTDWGGNAASGANTGQRRIVDTVYNAAGKAISQSEPYLVAAYGGSGSYYVTPSTTAHKITSAYDAASRTVQTIGLDGAVTSAVFGNRSLYSQDANNHIKASYFDAVGQLTAVDETIDRFSDEFNDGVLSNWSVGGNVSESGGVAHITGNNTWDTNIRRNMDTSGDEGVAFSFRSSNAAILSHIFLHYGTWGTSNYRRWSLSIVNGQLALEEYVGSTMTHTDLMPFKPNTWYRAVLKNTQSYAYNVLVVWEADNPAQAAEIQLAKDNSWNLPGWNFMLQVYTNNATLDFDNYDELEFNRTKDYYDLVGNLIQVTDPLNNITQMVYDAAGRKRFMDDPDMGQWYYAYDIAGNLQSQTDAKVQTIDFEYDDLNRLTAKRLGLGGPRLATYEYDDTSGGNKGFGRRTGMTAYYPAGVEHNSANWQYDILGRVTQETRQVAGNTYNFAFGYTQADVPVTITYPGGSSGQAGEVVTTNYYWQTGQPKTHIGDTNYVQQAQYYRADGQMTRLNMPDNTVYTSYGYDTAHRLSSIRTVDGGSNRLWLTYNHDQVGNIVSILDSTPPGGGSWQWQYFKYDSLNRLTDAYTTGGNSGQYDEYYAYNALGNLIDKAGVEYFYNGGKPHAVTALYETDNLKYWYDLNGNMTRRIDDQNRDWMLDWTAENMLHTATNDQNDSLRFVYDADGMMILRVEDEGQSSAQTTVYLGKIFEHDLTLDTYRKTYLFDGRMVSTRAGLTSGSGVSYFATDALGSVATTLYANGTVQAKKRYKPFGEERYSQNITPTGYRYTGQRWDSDLGLYDYNARYYDPALGRFISPDTLVPELEHMGLTVDFHHATLSQIASKQRSGSGSTSLQSFNRYAYARNNPINRNDPTGHSDILFEGDADPSQLNEMISGVEEAIEILEDVLDFWTGGTFVDSITALIGALGIGSVISILKSGTSIKDLSAAAVNLFQSLDYASMVGAVTGWLASTSIGEAGALAIGFVAPILVYAAIVSTILLGITYSAVRTSITNSLNDFKNIKSDLKSIQGLAGNNNVSVKLETGRWFGHKVSFSTTSSNGQQVTRTTHLGWTPLQVAGYSTSEALLAAWPSVMNSNVTP